MEQGADSETETTLLLPNGTNFTHNEKLGKRLAYILRYGAKKEGLAVSEKGFVNLCELMTIDLMKDYTVDEVKNEINISVACSGRKRFELKTDCNDILVRAVYRKFEPNPFHDGTQVTRLVELCMCYICKRIERYSLEEFPDEYLVREIIHKMKRNKMLSNKALRINLIGPGLEVLDLEGTYITEKTLDIIKRQGYNLKSLSLKGAGYLLTDHNFVPLIKKLGSLETLDISGCSHLTSVSFASIPGALPFLRRLNMSNLPNLSETNVFFFMTESKNLKYLQLYGNNDQLVPSVMSRILELCREKRIYVAVMFNGAS